MACNNGKKGFHSPYGMITDLNITYTGCATTCNGEEIKPGMRLREILDILIGNCAEGGSATWGDIIGNIEDQTDLVQFIQDNIPSASWGSILGDIEDQEDLVQFVQENGFGEDKIGSNLHLDGDGKVSLGVGGIPGGGGLLVISQDGDFPTAPENASLMLAGLAALSSGDGSNIALNANGGGISFSSGGDSLMLEVGAGRSANINGYFTYSVGMPSSPSDNVLPTIGYVRDTLVADAITAAITPLVQQISDLEDRVQALEDATP